MIGRNDPCPCGSGKKYKKCCAQNETVSSDQLVKEEAERVIGSYFENGVTSHADFADFERYERAWNSTVGPELNRQYSKNAMIDAFLFIERNDLWNRHLLKSLNGPLRSGTREVLEGWREPVVLLAKVSDVQNGRIICEQLLDHGVHEFEMMSYMDAPPKKGEYVHGFALPDKSLSERGVRIINTLQLSRHPEGMLEERLSRLAEESGLASSRDFYRNFAAEIYRLFNETIELDVQELLTPQQQEAFALLENEIQKHGGDRLCVEFAESLMAGYYQEYQPNVRKHEGVAAAIFLLLNEFGMVSGRPMTQKEIAALFGVSVSSMTRHLDPLEEMLEEAERETQHMEGPSDSYYVGLDPRPTERVNWEMNQKMAGRVFQSDEEVQRFFMEEANKPFFPETDVQRAQMLCYNGFDALDDEKKAAKFARQALELDPESVDAQLLLAELLHDDTGKAEFHLEKAVRLGEKTFEPAEIAWALVTNRPYMRALLALGVLRYEEERFGEAAELFEKLLVLNPSDHQGARYLAISSRLKNGDLEMAESLLAFHRPEGEDAAHAFLTWKLADLQRRPEAHRLFEEAGMQNQFVSTLVENGLPKLPYPNEMSVEAGSIEEAMYIWTLL